LSHPSPPFFTKTSLFSLLQPTNPALLPFLFLPSNAGHLTPCHHSFQSPYDLNKARRPPPPLFPLFFVPPRRAADTRFPLPSPLEPIRTALCGVRTIFSFFFSFFSARTLFETVPSAPPPCGHFTLSFLSSFSLTEYLCGLPSYLFPPFFPSFPPQEDLVSRSQSLPFPVSLFIYLVMLGSEIPFNRELIVKPTGLPLFFPLSFPSPFFFLHRRLKE